MIPTPFERPQMPPPGPIAPPPVEPSAPEAVETQPIPPEAVAYHDSNERCDSCEYMDPSGMCEYLKTQVDPGGHCTLYQMGSQGAADAGMGDLA